MINKETYSHENYRNILKEARIWEGTNDSFFAPVAGTMFLRRKPENPVSFAAARIGTKKNPLIQNIRIN